MPFNTLLAVQNCLTMNFVDLAMVSRAYKPVYERGDGWFCSATAVVKYNAVLQNAEQHTMGAVLSMGRALG